MNGWLVVALLATVVVVGLIVGSALSQGSGPTPQPPEIAGGVDPIPAPPAPGAIVVCGTCHGVGDVRHPSFGDNGWSECPTCKGSGIIPVAS